MPKKEKTSRPRLHLQTGNELPPGYKLQRTFNLVDDWRRALALDLLGALFCIGFGWFYLFLNLLNRPTLRDEIINLTTLPVLVVLGSNLGGVLLFYFIHELIHSLLLYFYTRTRPQLGFHLFYLNLSVPNWYLPRTDLLIVILAPLISLSLLGIISFWLIPSPVTLAFIFGLAMNAASSVGDCFIAVWLLRQRSNTLFETFGDSLNAYDAS